jgi:hypothetical protein
MPKASQSFSVSESASVTVPLVLLVLAAVFVVYGQSKANKRRRGQ